VSLQRWFDTWLEGVEVLGFPFACMVCEAEVRGSPFCEGCRDELLQSAGPACWRCAMPVGPWAGTQHDCSECRGRALGFDRAIALGPYQGPIRELCLRLKHERNAWIAPWLVDILLEARGDLLGAERVGCVAAIPLHWRHRLRRRFNQADLLGKRLANRLGVPPCHPLRRIVSTPKLAGRGRSERARLLKSAFRVRDSRAVEGQTVLLVDDILTTGATCGAAARALKRAGAKRVVVAVIGRAEGRT
jgi:ComF family protein